MAHLDARRRTEVGLVPGTEEDDFHLLDGLPIENPSASSAEESLDPGHGCDGCIFQGREDIPRV